MSYTLKQLRGAYMAGKFSGDEKPKVDANPTARPTARAERCEAGTEAGLWGLIEKYGPILAFTREHEISSGWARCLISNCLTVAGEAAMDRIHDRLEGRLYAAFPEIPAGVASNALDARLEDVIASRAHYARLA